MYFKTLSSQDRAKNFNKLWANDIDLSVILKAYARLGKQMRQIVRKSFVYSDDF
jgi:hypothetical protein